MKGLVFTFILAFALLVGTYGVMMGAIALPGKTNSPARTSIPSAPSRFGLGTQASPAETGNRLSHQAMEQVIDCYAGKPVYLDPEHSRPLYPDCERLLRIFQGQTTDPEEVLGLLAKGRLVINPVSE